jgi:hypothetical protein
MREFAVRIAALFIVSILLTAAPPALLAEKAIDAVMASDHPEARPFDAEADAKAAVDATLARAKAQNRLAIIVLGANWCHDSRALSGWFATPRFAAMLGERYEIAYVDVGVPTAGQRRNIAIAQRFGIKKIKGTPTVLIVDGAGQLLNKRSARQWRNAASRSENAIYRAFAEFTPD